MNPNPRPKGPYLFRRPTVGAVRSTACGIALAGAMSAGASGEARAQGPDSWTSPDKAAHFVASAPLGAVGASFAGPSASLGTRLLYGTLIGSLPGLAKELADGRNAKGDASVRDMVFNIAGAALGALWADRVLIRPIGPAGADRIDGVTIEYKIPF